MGRWHFRRSGWDKTVTKTDHERQLRRKGCWSPIPLILRRKDHVEVMGSYVIYIYIHTHIIYIYLYTLEEFYHPPFPIFFNPQIQTLNTSPCIICTQPCSSASLVFSHGFPKSSEVQVFLRGCGGRYRILPVSICKIYHLISFKKNVPYIFVILHRL